MARILFVISPLNYIIIGIASRNLLIYMHAIIFYNPAVLACDLGIMQHAGLDLIIYYCEK